MDDTDEATGDMAVAGDLLVADGARVRGNLRCDGRASVGRLARIDGNLDVGGPLVVRDGADIRGNVACAADVEWHPRASAAGFRCKGRLRVEGQLVAGLLEAPGGIAPSLEEEAA